MPKTERSMTWLYPYKLEWQWDITVHQLEELQLKVLIIPSAGKDVELL